MNRTTALFLALALLLAHALAIHHSLDGEYATICERAHVAFRMARNLVYEGRLAWSRDLPVAESYPSPLWIALNCIPLRLYSSPVHFVQGLGLISALLCVACVAAFSPRRMVGVIAPLLLVVNGSMASAASDGTETTLVAFALTAAYLSQVQGRAVALALWTSTLCLLRPEGVLVIAALALLELLRGSERRRALLFALLAPVGVELALAFARLELYGTPLSPLLADLWRRDPEQVRLGLEYTWANFELLVSPLLAVVPLLCLFLRRLSAVGAGALLLSGLWTATVVLTGGDERPFGVALVPAYPLLYVAAQESMKRLMDSRVRAWEPICWLLFVASMFASAVASKAPGDIGPFHLNDALLQRVQPSESMDDAWDFSLGRLGVQEEIDATERLRRISIFLRDRLEPDATLLTPWPGAIGYLTRKRVWDMRGRLAPLEEGQRPNSWTGARRTDLMALLAESPDYIVPGVEVPDRPPFLRQLARDWKERYDSRGDEPGRIEQYVERLLGAYQLIAVPLPDEEMKYASSSMPFYLLRRIDLELGPSLTLEREGDDLRVRLNHRGHRQLADLELRVRTSDGGEAWVRPTGRLSADVPAHARTGILLSKSDGPAIDLFRWTLPADLDWTEVSAVLRNPRSQDSNVYSTLCETVVLRP